MSFRLLDINEKEISEAYGIGPLAAKALAASHYSEDEIKEILSDDLTLHTSSSECIERAKNRILKAKEAGEKVFIGGDYDADGICATAIMKGTLDRLGINNGYYIPDRFKEGYGLSVKTVEMVKKRGYSLIITVDNGVKAKEAIEKAKELGIEIMITDHHRIEEDVLADIVVHPDFMEDQFSTLSGAGVALQLSRSLIGEVDEFTVLACVAAVGDVMPLWKETRRIVKNGLRLMRSGCLPSITSLVRKGSPIDLTAIGFQIVPKLNSVGRMNDLSNVNTLIPYLLCNDMTSISAYREQLENVNDMRKTLSAKMVTVAEKKCGDDAGILILYEETFHEGLNGLVAGRIANTKKKPVLVFSKSDGMIKGSGRSIKGFDMFAFFNEGFEELTAFGGHEQAVGLSMKEEDFEDFCKKVETKMQNIVLPDTEPVRNALKVKAEELTVSNIEGLSVLEPWPKGEIELLFALCDPVIENTFESPKVKKYHIANGEGALEAVLFAFKGLKEPESLKQMIGTVSINAWMNRKTPQLTIESFEQD